MPSFREVAVARVLRRYPLMSGRGTLANHRFVRKVTGCGSGACWSQVPGGCEILTPLTDYVGRAVFFTGDLDAKITALCRKIVRPGDTVIDIGANLGAVTYVLASLVGSTGQVHAFEPNPNLANLLSEARQRNNKPNVVVHQIALGDVAGVLPLAVPQGNLGAASLVPSRQKGDAISAQVHRLDDVLEMSRHIRLMKMDVEGFESQVLRGAIGLFDTNPPYAILFELNDGLTGPLIENDTYRFLHERGYSLYSIPRTLFRARLEATDAHASTRPISHDFLAMLK
jgi:FkbM family methyltransferase